MSDSDHPTTVPAPTTTHRDPYRHACPHGHRSVRRRGRQWQCEACRRNGEIDGYYYDRVTDLRADREVAAADV
jgi:ribosomal protein L37AE/L43A